MCLNTSELCFKKLRQVFWKNRTMFKTLVSDYREPPSRTTETRQAQRLQESVLDGVVLAAMRHQAVLLGHGVVEIPLAQIQLETRAVGRVVRRMGKQAGKQASGQAGRQASKTTGRPAGRQAG